ncbi:hypothetical protein FRB94_004254 [Tulasnella sp. JGI-2019a]|nr:hypothetical protein FRB93_000254 [Tulasnella sp. JGI-2019a]KAG9015135.1 hypothetical protein FRB94_004254 [Tulasnella sp. JGI-2019a]KAG9039204.1 hypothetical protein FRB95_011789 [Tulasnella sp. JGI-2019a]
MSKNDVIDEYKATLASREKHIKETWIGAMEARLVREELIKCQRAEGVNHYAECKHLAEMYLRMMKTSKVTGYKQIDLA